MKIAILTVIFVTGVTATAQARLGETTDQLTARYGDALSEIDQKGEGTHLPLTRLMFQKGGFQINVTVLNGVSVEEIYKKLNGEAFTDEEERTLLADNSEGGEWAAPQPVNGAKTWAKDDGSMAALADGKVLKITSKDLIAQQTAVKNTEAQPSLEGF